MTAMPAEYVGRYACPVETCGRRFRTLPEKKAHMRLKHDKPKKTRR